MFDERLLGKVDFARLHGKNERNSLLSILLQVYKFFSYIFSGLIKKMFAKFAPFASQNLNIGTPKATKAHLLRYKVMFYHIRFFGFIFFITALLICAWSLSNIKIHLVQT